MCVECVNVCAGCPVMDWQPIQGVFLPSSVPGIGLKSTITVMVNEACKRYY